MSKALCLFALALSIILAVVLTLDLSMGIPFQRGSIVMDGVFLAISLVIAILSWLTYREQ